MLLRCTVGGAACCTWAATAMRTETVSGSLQLPLTGQHDLAAAAGDYHGEQELVGRLDHARLAHVAAKGCAKGG